MDGARTPASGPIIPTKRGASTAANKTGRKGLIVCSELPVCQFNRQESQRHSAASERAGLHVCSNISRHSHAPVMASLVAASRLVDVSGEGCEVVIFEDNLRGACDTIDSGQNCSQDVKLARSPPRRPLPH